MRLLLILSIQILLMAAGSCLWCETCESTSDGSNDCSGQKTLCPKGQLCLVLHTRILYKDQYLSTRAVRRQCWNSHSCYKSGAWSSPSYRIQYTTDCCSTDDCKLPLPALPPDKNTHNGLVCPACHSNRALCVPKVAMKCTGEETLCFNLTNGETPLAAFGCASANYYNVRNLIGEIFRNNNWEFRPIEYTIKKAEKTSHLPVVNFLSCRECHGLVGRNCDKVVKCPPEHDACLTIIMWTTHGEKEYSEMIRRCGFSSECSTAGTITTEEKVISKNTSCCYTDNCVSPLPTAPPKNKKTNGILCESCYYKTYGVCLGQDYIPCTGDATQCISYTTELKDEFFTSSEVFRGCAHPELCHSGNRTVVKAFSTFKETVICGVTSDFTGQRPNMLHLFIVFVIYVTF